MDKSVSSNSARQFCELLKKFSATDTQIKQAAEWIAEAIDNLAKEGIFPSVYDQGVIDRHVG